MDKVTIIIFSTFVFLLILLFVLTVIIKSKRRKNIIQTIDKLTTEKNLIISASLISELAKSTKLANNKKQEKEIEKRYKFLKRVWKLDEE
ncbi:MAG: hypothetical protein GX758_01120 [Tenericutes bacterium]|nr:hypothetical protein [Mycoplasmatota bacterium]